MLHCAVLGIHPVLIPTKIKIHKITLLPRLLEKINLKR